MSLRSGVWAVVFTDMVDSTAQRARVGDVSADALRRVHDQIAERAVRRFAGEFVKGTGDGAMLAFPSAADAVAAAVEIQRGVSRHDSESGEAIRIRVGVSLGEVECEGTDLHGLAVNEAARVCALADADEIVISDLVRVVGGSRLAAPLEDRGLVELKGIPGQVAVWSVAWRSVAEPAPAPFPSLLDSARQPPFNGRSGELARLAEAWTESSGGSCRAVLMSGEPGIGKTRLAAEFTRRAYGQGATVLYGTCDEALATPFQPFAEALDWYCDHAPVVSFGRYPGDLARLSDRVADRMLGPPQPMRAEAESERHRLFESVTSWLAAEAELSPVVLVVDDLHWATRETLLLLRHVLRGAADSRLFVVGTYRDTELDRQHPLSEMLADFARLGTVDRIALLGLDEPDVLGLVCSFLDVEDTSGSEADASALARSILTETAGNAFFVTEVLRNLVDTSDAAAPLPPMPAVRTLAAAAIPQGVRDAIGQRLTRLGDDVTTVLRAAAVAGAAFTLSSVVAAAGVGDDEVVEVLERACAVHLAEEISADRFRFAHALVRSTLLGEISTTRRLRMHRAIASRLEVTDPDNAADIAYHWCAASEAGDLDKAVRYSIAAAEVAMAHTAYNDACAIAQRALELVDHDDNFELSLLWARGHAEVAIGDPAAYRLTFRRIADLASEAGDPVAYAEAALGYVGRDETLTDLDDFARNALERSLAELDRSTEPALVGRLLGALASGVTNWEPDRADRLSLEALDLARAANSPEMFTHAARARLRCWWDPNATQERLALAAEFRDAATAAGLPDSVAQSWQWETILRLESAELERDGPRGRRNRTHQRNAQPPVPPLGRDCAPRQRLHSRPDTSTMPSDSSTKPPRSRPTASASSACNSPSCDGFKAERMSSSTSSSTTPTPDSKPSSPKSKRSSRSRPQSPDA